MSLLRRFAPALLLAAAILSMSGGWGSEANTAAATSPLLTGLFGLTPETAALMNRVGRKLGHVAAYALLGWTWLRALAPSGPVRARIGAAAVALAVVVACADEGLQRLAPDRGGALRDVALDGAGALLAVLVVAAMRAASARAAAPPAVSPRA